MCCFEGIASWVVHETILWYIQASRAKGLTHFTAKESKGSCTLVLLEALGPEHERCGI